MTYNRTSTVITKADSYDLVELSALKADLGITGATDDVYLQRAISRASAAAAQYCNRVFLAETVQDVFDFRRHQQGTGMLLASRFPIISVTSLTQEGVALVEDVDFRVDRPSGRIFRLHDSDIAGIWCGAPVTLVYSAGFDPDAEPEDGGIPYDLQSAVTSMVQAQQFNRTRDPLLRSENILSGLYAYTLFDPSQIPAGTAQQVSATLDAYRVAVIA